MKKRITPLLFLFLPLSLFGQDLVQPDSALVDTLQTPAAISIIALSQGDKTILRWAPTTAGAWQIGRRSGYRLERALLTSGVTIETASFRSLTGAAIVPWEYERFAPEELHSNQMLQTVGQALHGETFETQLGRAGVGAMLAQAQELEDRWIFSTWAADLDSTAAEALALRHVDDGTFVGAQYLYRVFPVHNDPAVPVDTGYVFVTAENIEDFAGPASFEADPQDGRINLSWEIGLPGQFSGFWLERSSDGSSFQRIHDAPIAPLNRQTETRIIYQDTLTTNYVTYQYRLSGMSPFGISSPAAETSSYSRDLKAPSAPFIEAQEHVEESTVKIEWSVGDELPSDFEGFYVGHALAHEGPFSFDFESRFGPNAREGLDSRAISNQQNYFIVIARDTSGNGAASLPVLVQLQDSIPPITPSGFRVVSVEDSTGAVTFEWDAPQEPDFYGYRLYRAHAQYDEYVLRQDELVYGNTFTDTLNLESLSTEVYYQLSALDYSYNASERSTPFRIELPDLLPPVTPVFTLVASSDSTIAMEWNPSSSFDVEAQILYRREAPATLWSPYQSLAADENGFIDKDVKKRQVYEYSLQAVDSTGLKSNLSLPVKGRPYDTGLRAGVINIRAVPDTTRGVVRLSWEYPAAASDKHWFVVYRSLSDGPLSRYKSVGKELDFEDHRVKIGSETQFTYGVQVLYKDGGMSELSEGVSVTYPRE